MLTVGLISDTHGLLRPEALAMLRGSDFIIHAGDVGDPGILDALAGIAPLTVVRGNIDTQSWAAGWPSTAVLQVGGLAILVLHDIADLKPGLLDTGAAGAGYRVVVTGHSHRPRIWEQDGVLFVNPGSAGRRRFKLPISLGRLRVADGRATAEIIGLDSMISAPGPAASARSPRAPG